MHASLAVSLAYDRYLNGSPGDQRTLEECQHFSQSITLFRRRLLAPITPGDKDAIWGTAAALALLAFASPEASIFENSWPLMGSKPSCLEWLRMSEGKMSLWCATDPLRPDSIFRILAGIYNQMNSPIPPQGIDGIPRPFISLCELNDSSTAKSNAYFNAVHVLSEIQRVPDGHVTVGHTERFSRCICGPFMTLLVEKDPTALLLLYLWYQKAKRSIWWMGTRAWVECPAISSYLALHHAEHYATLELFE